MSVRVAVFASGSGTNLQALLDHFTVDASAIIALVISDRGDAGALTRAAAAGVATQHIEVRGRAAADVERDMLSCLEQHGIELVALAGYMRLVPAGVTQQFRGRIMNIHPALLPSFGGQGMYGRRVHVAVLAAGCTVTGATVHWVDERYDEGRIIAQWPVPILPGDTAESLAERVLAVEHRLYPAAVAAVARRLRAAGRAVAPTAGTVYRLAGSLDHLEDEITASAGL